MSNAIKAPDERQVATGGVGCSSCVSTGHGCTWCGKSFRLGDLKITLQGSPPGERAHILCSIDARLDGSEIVAVEVSLPEDVGADDPVGFFARGAALVDDLSLALVGWKGDMAPSSLTWDVGVLAAKYQGELERSRGKRKPVSHVGSSHDVSRCCDFCSGKQAAGSLGPLSFWHYVTSAPGEAPIHYQGRWAYCRDCEPHVESKNHLELARRAMSARQPRELDPERRRRHFEGLYERVVHPVRSV